VKKWIIATLMTATAICASTGAKETAAAPGPADPVEYGGCRYVCSTTGTPYLTAAKCQASCSGFCDEVC